ncbi:hypothetical protein PIB30_077100 [Stylosanthes scabra]|uniref:Uncharacterized protein n=1 Tax=Stylosanthes scabra TaxID=79078 RepID=A0ABU6XSK7_9FABA|nr:hypothetical protein [Stylosanthes scabra]
MTNPFPSDKSDDKLKYTFIDEGPLSFAETVSLSPPTLSSNPNRHPTQTATTTLDNPREQHRRQGRTTTPCSGEAFRVFVAGEDRTAAVRRKNDLRRRVRHSIVGTWSSSPASILSLCFCLSLTRLALPQPPPSPSLHAATGVIPAAVPRRLHPPPALLQIQLLKQVGAGRRWSNGSFLKTLVCWKIAE